MDMTREDVDLFSLPFRISYIYKVLVLYENTNQSNEDKYALLQLFMLTYRFHLFLSLAVVWFLFGVFLFLICVSIPIIIPTFAAGIMSKTKAYATSEKTRQSQGANPASDERIVQWQQEPLFGYLP